MADYYSLNRVILIGRVVRDPEFWRKDNTKRCSLSLATNEIFSVRTSEDNREARKKVEYHNLISWGKTAETIYKYVKKGVLLCIEGKLRTETYKKEGEETKRYVAKVEVMSFSILQRIDEAAAAEGQGEEAEGQEPEEAKPGDTEEAEEKPRKPRKSKKEPKDECPF